MIEHELTFHGRSANVQISLLVVLRFLLIRLKRMNMGGRITARAVMIVLLASPFSSFAFDPYAVAKDINKRETNDSSIPFELYIVKSARDSVYDMCGGRKGALRNDSDFLFIGSLVKLNILGAYLDTQENPEGIAMYLSDKYSGLSKYSMRLSEWIKQNTEKIKSLNGLIDEMSNMGTDPRAVVGVENKQAKYLSETAQLDYENDYYNIAINCIEWLQEGMCRQVGERVSKYGGDVCSKDSVSPLISDDLISNDLN